MGPTMGPLKDMGPGVIVPPCPPLGGPGSCAFLFPYVHANDAKHELCWFSIIVGRLIVTFVTNFCSWFIVITIVVKINVFFGFVLWFP